MIAGESSEESDAFEDELAALTDDVGIGEDVSASVSAALGDVEDAEAAIIEAVDAQEDIDPIGSAYESGLSSAIDETAADAFEDSGDLMAGVGSDEEHVIQDDAFVMGTDQHEVGVLLDDEMSIGGIDLDAPENLASMDSVEDSLEETSVFEHDEGQFEGIEGAGVDNGLVSESLDTKGDTVDSNDIDLDALESQIAAETVNQNADKNADIRNMLAEGDSEEQSIAHGDARELSLSQASSVQVRGLEGVNRESLTAG